MKKFLFIVLLANLTLSIMAQNEGFNFIVHNKTHLQTREEYSIKTLFPIQGKQIHDIRMDLHLGCPDGKCSDWDYSINVVMRKVIGTDTLNFQLGRMITPYSGWYNRGENANSWDHIWSWNVTEYLPLMRDSVEIVVSYEGYQDGFLATTDFVFNSQMQKKAPEFISVENVYFGYYPFGREDSTIDQFIPTREITIPKGTKQVLARMTVSGHGGDKLNAAAEFLEKSYYYYVNNSLVASQSVWRDDCGCNPIQPQGGTWIYNRAGWCPGTKVDEHYYDLTPFIRDGKLKINMTFDYYNGHNSGDAGYQIANDIFFIKDANYQHQIIEDGEFNLKREDIELPKNFVLAFRTNHDARDTYKIFETTGSQRVLYEQKQFSSDKEYLMPVHLEADKNYALEVKDDGCDGMAWWANPEQGAGYVLILSADSSQVLEAFDPDFGCTLLQGFKAVDTKYITHKENKCISVFDAQNKQLQVIFINKNNEFAPMQVQVINRKTSEIVYDGNYFDNQTFNQVIEGKRWAEGYYMAIITCNGTTEQYPFIKWE